MAKHRCDYCPWYWAGRCDCPIVMKESACESASRKKREFDRLSNTNDRRF